MIRIKHSGSFSRTEKFLKHAGSKYLITTAMLKPYGDFGVSRLQAMTPVDTGDTAHSWFYKIKIGDGKASITWHNSHVENHCNIAIILQYGHATRQGGWVEGRDYINPALIPVFNRMADDIWREVTRT